VMPGCPCTNAGVNNAGTVVGIADYDIEYCPDPPAEPDEIVPFFGHAFRATSGHAMEDLGTFDDDPGGPGSDCAYSEAIAVNASGAVVGESGKESLGGYGTFTEGCSGDPNGGEIDG
jgi:hypothetical protein